MICAGAASPVAAQYIRLGKAASVVLQPAPKLAPAPEEKKIEVLSADRFERTGDIVSASGNVHIRYKEYDLRAEKLEANLATEIFSLSGKVKVLSEKLNVEGDFVEVDTKAQAVKFQSSSAVVQPSLVGEQLKSPLYVRGEGSGDQRRFVTGPSGVTTCDLDHPHWEIRAKSLDVRPGDVMVMRSAQLKIGNRTIFTLPYLSIPLIESLPRYIPQIGSSPDEGYFMKTRFGLDVRGKELLDGRFDLMSRRGMGLGADYKYSLGSLAVYTILGANRSATAQLQHAQKLFGARLNASSNYNRLNYLNSPQSTSWNLRTGLQWSNARLDFNRNTNESPTFRSETQNLLLNTNWRLLGWAVNTDSNVSLSLSKSLVGSGFRSERRVADVRARATRKFTDFDAELLYSRSIPISEIVGFFNSSDQTPILNLDSDTKRLLGARFTAPLRFSMGELVDPSRQRPVTRMLFSTNLPGTQLKSGKLALSPSGRFRQSFYSDDTAQFVGQYGANLRYSIGNGGYIQTNYNYLRAQGYSPLLVDREGRSDATNLEVELRPNKATKAAFGTGYDFLDRPNKITPWQNLNTRLEWFPGEQLKTKLYSTYDTFNQVWSSIRLDGLYERGEQRFGLGVRFDGTRHTFGAVNVLAQGMRWGNLGISALWSYNGYTRRFDTQQYAVSYDLHCAEALVTFQDNRSGFRNGKFIGFYLRLKALPFATPFGTGTKGQSFGGVGGIGF